MGLVIRTTGIEDYLDGGEAYIKALIMGPPSAGKGHPVETQLLTPTGWQELGKLQVGDEVVGSDGHATMITAVHERGVLPIKRVVFNDGSEVRVDPEHLWLVDDRHGPQVVQTQDLGSLTRMVGETTVLRWAIPTVAPVEHPHAELPLHPYVLGALLANGYLGEENTQLTVAFGPEWESHIERIEAFTPRWMAVREVTRKRNATARQFHLHDCLPIMRELGLSGKLSRGKFIPRSYLHADIEQRRELLAGLMDADGGVRGTWAYYYSTCESLARDVVELVRSLGGYAELRVQRRHDKPTEFNVAVGFEQDNPFRAGPKVARWQPARRTTRRIAAVEDDGFAEVRCISVAARDSLYVTEHHLLTHNTRSASFWPKPIFADCEKGRMSIADRKVPYGEVTSSKDMDDLLLKCKQECQKPVRSRAYQTLVIDTLDAYQRIVIQERLTSEKKEALSGWADWGYLDAKMTQFVAKLLALPMNIVVNVHTKDTKGGDDDPVITGIKLKGDLKEQIAAEFDLVGLMGTFWESKDGERVLSRAIKWHPEPNVPILKDRSGRLPRYTPVTFTEDDYNQLFDPLIQALDELSDSTVVEELPRDEAATPVPPVAGGPVPIKATPEARPAAKKAAAAKVPAAAKPAVPPAAKPGADSAPTVQSVPEGSVDTTTGVLAEESSVGPTESDAEPAMTPDQVAESLGGEVISDSQDDDVTPTAASTQVPQQEQRQVPTCGTPGQMSDGTVNESPVSGCGKTLADESRDLVNIAYIKTRTYLCGACFQAYKATTTK